MTTTEKLQDKISQLTTKVEELRKQSDIDPMSASPDQIMKNAQDELQARESAEHLETVITQLRSQLAEVKEEEDLKLAQERVKDGFKSLEKQSDRVIAAIEKLEEELAKLKEMGKTLSSEHSRVTGKFPVDDRLDRNYLLPKVEKLNEQIIIHNQSRNYL